ncbi:hypothetical protein [Microcoleus sp. herbarium14]|uniref:hypothetical protein n=1 Tax=Microcoleus sp. herbarium14 TaxID=3055439 RepID=UPI002FD4341E
MSAKKRKPLDSVLEEFVFGTKEAALLPTAPEVAPPAATPTASLSIRTGSTRSRTHPRSIHGEQPDSQAPSTR